MLPHYLCQRPEPRPLVERAASHLPPLGEQIGAGVEAPCQLDEQAGLADPGLADEEDGLW